MTSVDAVRIDEQHPPTASAIVYKKEDKVIAKKWLEQRDRWVTLAKGEAGVDDAEVIQEALDVGGIVFIKRGVYLIQSPLSLSDNLTLKGEGWNTVLKLADGANTHLIYDMDSKENIIIQDLAFDGNYDNQTDGAGRDDRVLVRLHNKNNIRFENVKFMRTRHGEALALNFASNVELVGCYFKDNGHPDSSYPCDHIHFIAHNLRVVDCLFESSTDTAIAMDNCTKATVTNCIFYHNIHDMTFYNLSDSATPPEGLTVSNCVGVGQEALGRFIYINIASGQTNKVSKVVVSNCIILYHEEGIHVENCERVIISGCYLCNQRNIGSIFCQKASYVKIANNIIADSEYGIRFGTEGITDHVDILYNTLINLTYPVAGLENATNLNIKGNTGYTTENSGTATFSGDGSTTDFLIGDHGLAITDPDKIVVKVTPISSDAIAASPCVGYVDPNDNTKIRVKFASAPASGTDNVKIAWEAEVI